MATTKKKSKKIIVKSSSSDSDSESCSSKDTSSSGSDSEPKKKLKKPTLPHMGIHRLMVGFVQKSVPKTESKLSTGESRLTHDLVGSYNQQLKDKAVKLEQEAPVGYRYYQATKALIGPFQLHTYRMETQINGGKMQTALGPYVDCNTWPQKVILHYLIFLRLVEDKKTSALFALTTGDSYRVVAPYSDYSFPRHVAKCFLDAKNIKWEKSRHITGDLNATTTFYKHSHEMWLTESYNNLVQFFSAALRKGTDLTKEGALFASKQTQIEVSLRQVKVRSGLTLPDMASVVTVFNAAYESNDSKLEDPGFKFLDNIKPVSPSKVADLNEAFIKHLFEILKDSKEVDFDFYGREFTAFWMAEKFKLVQNNITQEWEGSFTLSSVLRVVMSQFKPGKWEDLKDLNFGYCSNGRWTVEPFVNFLQGEFVFKDNKYFRIDGKWYEISGDFLKSLGQDFRTKLRDTQFLPKLGSEYALPFRWESGEEDEALVLKKTDSDSEESEKKNKTKNLNPTYLKQKLEIKSAEAKKLMEALKTAKIVEEKSKKNKVISSDIKADINKNKSELEKLFKEAIGKVKKGEKIEDKMAKKLQDLETVLQHFLDKNMNKKRVMKEDAYNKKYLDQPFYIVGDKRTPQNLELFDVLKIHNGHLYFYHNKIGIGQSVRDVCSQVRNAAKAIDGALKSNASKNNLLGQLYEVLIKDDVNKHKLGNISKEEFVRLMRSVSRKNVHFVFGFMNKFQREAPLEAERDRKEKDKSLIESNIAKLELLLTCSVVSEIGFTFSVVTVEKENVKKEDQATKTSSQNFQFSSADFGASKEYVAFCAKVKVGIDQLEKVLEDIKNKQATVEILEKALEAASNVLKDEKTLFDNAGLDLFFPKRDQVEKELLLQKNKLQNQALLKQWEALKNSAKEIKSLEEVDSCVKSIVDFYQKLDSEKFSMDESEIATTLSGFQVSVKKLSTDFPGINDFYVCLEQRIGLYMATRVPVEESSDGSDSTKSKQGSAIESQIKISHSRFPIKSFNQWDTSADNNCAFNAFLLTHLSGIHQEDKSDTAWKNVKTQLKRASTAVDDLKLQVLSETKLETLTPLTEDDFARINGLLDRVVNYKDRSASYELQHWLQPYFRRLAVLTLADPNTSSYRSFLDPQNTFCLDLMAELEGKLCKKLGRAFIGRDTASDALRDQPEIKAKIKEIVDSFVNQKNVVENNKLIKKAKEDLLAWFENEGFKHYLLNMSKGGTWGGPYELHALAELFGLSLFVVKPPLLLEPKLSLGTKELKSDLDENQFKLLRTLELIDPATSTQKKLNFSFLGLTKEQAKKIVEQQFASVVSKNAKNGQIVSEISKQGREALKTKFLKWVEDHYRVPDRSMTLSNPYGAHWSALSSSEGSFNLSSTFD